MRSVISEQDADFYKDMALRAYGILTNCHSLDENEMMDLLAKIKLGNVLGFIDIEDDGKFQKLFSEGLEANLKELYEFSDKKKENIIRAKYISDKVRLLARRG